MERWTLLACLVIGCGARTELGSPCTACADGSADAGPDVEPKDAPTDVAVDVPFDVPLNLCGNGVVDPGEQCDLGSANSNTPIPFHVSQASVSFDVMPLVRAKSSVAFYDYVGASSHTGLEVQGESRLYLYIDSSTSDLSFIVNHNIFGKGSGHATMSITALPLGFSIAESDDAGEFVSTGATTAKGNWNWSSNTDGGVIGSLACPAAWTIDVSADLVTGITSFVWVNADTSRSPLTIGQAVSVESFARCRTNCTIPACGQ
jgi:hypothetical protein